MCLCPERERKAKIKKCEDCGKEFEKEPSNIHYGNPDLHVPHNPHYDTTC